MLAALFFLLVFRDPSGRVLFRPDSGPEKLIVKGEAYEFAPSPDGRQVIYTLSGEGPNRTLVLWDAATAKSRNLISGLVRDARWSADGRHIAFLKHTGEWRAWLMPVAEPAKARPLSTRPVHSMAGWSGDALVVSDSEALHWLAPDGTTRQSKPLAAIYGKQFQSMSSDHIRFHPTNPDLLLISAFYMDAPKGSPVDDMDLNASIFLYDLKTG